MSRTFNMSDLLPISVGRAPLPDRIHISNSGHMLVPGWTGKGACPTYPYTGCSPITYIVVVVVTAVCPESEASP